MSSLISLSPSSRLEATNIARPTSSHWTTIVFVCFYFDGLKIKLNLKKHWIDFCCVRRRNQNQNTESVVANNNKYHHSIIFDLLETSAFSFLHLTRYFRHQKLVLSSLSIGIAYGDANIAAVHVFYLDARLNFDGENRISFHLSGDWGSFSLDWSHSIAKSILKTKNRQIEHKAIFHSFFGNRWKRNRNNLIRVCGTANRFKTKFKHGLMKSPTPREQKIHTKIKKNVENWKLIFA